MLDFTASTEMSSNVRELLSEGKMVDFQMGPGSGFSFSRSFSWPSFLGLFAGAKDRDS